ncbi:MAG: aminotransferase class I/II-fold pyridoxal phosphate-dependent enzyme [Tissierellia bacterium]|nr:aminotransferase class I/II-fold pyridoxal phosphate-dependent enzyme [Tissierellia bacterium]
MKKYICREVRRIENALSFGMPGHKGRDYFDLRLSSDVTEFWDTDFLLHPQGAIEKSQKEVAKLFGAKESFYITNGSSGALHIALSLFTKRKSRVLIQRNTHQSIYHGMILQDLEPVYLSTKYDWERGFYVGIDLKELEEKLKANSIDVAVFVSPNYYGGILRLKEIVHLCHTYHVPVIVDEAHGAHLYFGQQKNLGALAAGADLVVHSTHKMIPSLTQTALLHIGSDRVRSEEVLRAMKLFLSTSPSYLFLQSQEEGLDYMEKEGSLRMKEVIRWRKELHQEYGIANLQRPDESLADYDPLKFLFQIRGRSGHEIVENLFLRYNIRLEMGDLYYGLAILSPLHNREEIQRLGRAVQELSQEEGQKNWSIHKIIFPKIEQVLSPREAFDRPTQWVELSQGSDRISGGIIALYPPGVPLVSYGERIGKEILEEIQRYQEAGLEVLGIENGKIEVVK